MEITLTIVQELMVFLSVKYELADKRERLVGSPKVLHKSLIEDVTRLRHLRGLFCPKKLLRIKVLKLT